MKLNRKSGYQISFEEYSKQTVRDLYEEGLKFREKRRFDEMHNHFTFKWDSDEESEISEEEIVVDQKSNFSKEDGENLKDKNVEVPQDKKFENCEDAQVKEVSELLSKSTTCNIIDEIKESSNIKDSEKLKESKKNLKKLRLVDKPKFALYGLGSRDCCVGDKKTFNVNYQKELKGKNRKIQQKTFKAKSTSSEEKKFVPFKKKETIDWQSEYTRSFSSASH